MLKYFSSIWDYRAFLKSHKSSLDSSQHLRLSSKSFLSASHKLKKLDPSLVQDILLPLYSSTLQADLLLILLFSSGLLFLCSILAIFLFINGAMI